MNVNPIIKSVLEPEGLPVVPGIYTGTSDKYYTFNYEDDRAIVYANDTPQIDVASIQVHLFVPIDFNYIALKKRTRSRLFGAGFSYPVITEQDEKDTKKKHIIFQCEIDGQSETEE
ncbi:MAG: hypothetical protein K0S76_432 [Herbinix sp.]|jgi:hypothetical protein|nr:hypothetical protein [Herbinix sp.]